MDRDLWMGELSGLGTGLLLSWDCSRSGVLFSCVILHVILPAFGLGGGGALNVFRMWKVGFIAITGVRLSLVFSCNIFVDFRANFCFIFCEKPCS